MSTRCVSSVLTFKWRDIRKSCIFPQQTTRDSKRRASKEASALAKDGQPVNISSSGDAEPGNACDERWRRAKTLRRERWTFTRRWDGDLLKVCGWCSRVTFARSRPSMSVRYNISTCICLHPKISGCCIFVVPLQMHVWSREWVRNSVPALHHAFLPCLRCQSGNVSLC